MEWVSVADLWKALGNNYFVRRSAVAPICELLGADEIKIKTVQVTRDGKKAAALPSEFWWNGGKLVSGWETGILSARIKGELWTAFAVELGTVSLRRAGIALPDSLESRSSGRGRRKGVGGHRETDAPLVAQMKDMLDAKQVTSPYAAAVKLAHQAQGGGEEEGKRKRLVDRFYEAYPRVRAKNGQT